MFSVGIFRRCRRPAAYNVGPKVTAHQKRPAADRPSFSWYNFGNGIWLYKSVLWQIL